MHKLFYIKKWKKWNANSFSKNNDKNFFKKNDKSFDNKIVKKKKKLEKEKIYNIGFKKGKEIRCKKEFKKKYLHNKKNKLEIKKIKSLFLSFKKSIKSIDSYISVKIVKIFFNIVKKNNKIFNNGKTKKLIKKVKKYLFKECIFLNNLTFKINPKDSKLVKKNIINFLKFKNWMLIEDSNISVGECEIVSPEINVNFTNTDNWDNLYRIFFLEKN
ncbi:FliH/SctL family protein [Buchnera aphidicola (Pseudoregma panicola)]|uniref:FliH/SctL family protein n=1 Tax=Buchnera aphidicola TaxID=9 RepID=UPI0031B6CFE1